MKRVTVEAVCDGSHPGEVLASIEFEVSIKGTHGGKPVVIDACGQCANGPILALQRMIERAAPPRRGRPPKAKVLVRPDGYRCPSCEFVGKTPGGLSTHRSRKGH